MKRSQEPNKFYYDITIDHNTKNLDRMYGIASKAETTIDLLDPLLEQPGDFNLEVTKFKIDTESVPLMIPELAQPQLISDLEQKKFMTNYVVTVKYKEDNEENVNIYVPFHKKDCIPYVNGQVIIDGEIEKVYVDNVNELCFIYDYNLFIAEINNAIAKGFSELQLKAKMAFTLNNDRLSIDYENFNDDIEVLFSFNLYKYIGNGFQCSFIKKGWQIDRSSYSDEIKQSFTTLANWHCMKALVIGSDSFPVVGEFLPIAFHDGFLTHYENEEYNKGLKHLGIEYERDNKDTYKRNNQRILMLYYPLTSSPGDIRSCVIHSTDNISDGQYVELYPSSPIQKINIWVKWLDTYGNLHDLYLYPGCAVDIRLCFFKKSLIREDLEVATSAIVEALPEKRPKEEPIYSNGRNDGFVLAGADQYGFMHI